MEDKLSLIPGALEEMDELSRDFLGQGIYRDEKVAFGSDPVVLRFIEAASGDNQMQVWMKEHVLVPGVQDRCEADMGAQSLPTSGKFKKRPGCGLEEHGIHDELVLKDQWV